MSKLIDEIVTLTNAGWRPYRGMVQDAVYEKLDCQHGLLGKRETRVRPYWFARGEIFLCVGCSRKCSLARPAGFMPPLPIKHNITPDEVYNLTPQEMIGRRVLLNVSQAAYCLNVPHRTIYRYMSEGKLPPTLDRPLRVRAVDVAAMMQAVDD